MHDVIIIGAGPAGITAAIYTIRKSLDTLVISEDVGGQTAWSGDIENYTGYQFVSGPDLTAKFEEHMKHYGIRLKEGEKVVDLKKINDVFTVKSEKGAYSAKTVIIASGKKSKELNAPGEKEFKNRGLTYCATCDGPIFSKKDVVIVGGGNSALDAALQLITIANKVYIVNISSALDGDAIMLEKVLKSEKVKVFNDSQVTAILGDKFVNKVMIKNKEREEVLSVEGVFVEIGLIPNSDFAKGIEKNELGEIKVNKHNETSIKGIFAAGDVTDVPEKQIIVAAGEGAKSALSVFNYLSRIG
ncbi:MAG: FAD-dependent oxidoreductase [Candidatus Omnitrophota bacterium]